MAFRTLRARWQAVLQNVGSRFVVDRRACLGHPRFGGGGKTDPQEKKIGSNGNACGRPPSEEHPTRDAIGPSHLAHSAPLTALDPGFLGCTLQTNASSFTGQHCCAACKGHHGRLATHTHARTQAQTGTQTHADAWRETTTHVHYPPPWVPHPRNSSLPQPLFQHKAKR